MHARVTAVTVKPENADEMTRIYQNEVVPVITSQKGSKAVYLLIDRATGEGISLTVWESEADGAAYESSGTYQAQVDKVRHFFTAAPSLKTYEVAAQAVVPARVTG